MAPGEHHARQALLQVWVFLNRNGHVGRCGLLSSNYSCLDQQGGQAPQVAVSIPACTACQAYLAGGLASSLSKGAILRLGARREMALARTCRRLPKGLCNWFSWALMSSFLFTLVAKVDWRPLYLGAVYPFILSGGRVHRSLLSS